MDLKLFFTFEKKRVTYAIPTSKLHIHIEYIVNFGTAIEIEIMTTQEQSIEAKKIILSMLQKLGIRNDQIVEKTVTGILMEKLSTFDGSIQNPYSS